MISSVNSNSLPVGDTLPNDPAVTVEKLGNGFTYYLARNTYPNKGLASLRLIVKVGSLDEADEEQGVAHMLEHCVIKETASFSKETVDEFLKSLGCIPCVDSNAGTGQDHTRYWLDLSIEDPIKLEKAIQYLSEVAFHATLTDEVIDSERGVILDEIRIKKEAARYHFNQQQLDARDAGSLYPQRIPSGKEEIVKNGSGNLLRDFYKKWYQPNNMGLVVVGDIEKEPLRQLIDKYFGQIPTKELPERYSPTFTQYSETRTFLSKEPKETSSTVGVDSLIPPDMQKGDWSKTLAKTRLVAKCAMNMLACRFIERSMEKDPPFISAEAKLRYFHGRPFFLAKAVSWRGKMPQALEGLLLEVKRAQEEGFTPQEFDDSKARFLRSVRESFKERDKVLIKSKVNQYSGHFLENFSFPSVGDQAKVEELLVEEMTLPEVNRWIKELDLNQNRILWGRTFDAEPIEEKDFLEVEQKVATQQLAPYRPIEKKTLMPSLPSPGKILSEKYVEEVDATLWQLENGMRVWVKPTDFDADVVLLEGNAKGGELHLPLEEYLATIDADLMAHFSGVGQLNKAELRKELAGKGISFSARIGLTSRSMEGSCPQANFETLMQWIHLAMVEPRLDSEFFERVYKMHSESNPNRVKEGEEDFKDAVNRHNFSNYPVMCSQSKEELSKLNFQSCQEAASRWFSNPEEFTLIFTGNMDKEQVKTLVERYLASIAKKSHRFSLELPEIPFPEGVTRKEVVAGDKESTTKITFPCRVEKGARVLPQVTMVLNIIESKIHDRLRRQIGKTYTPSCSEWVDFAQGMGETIPHQLRISFTSDPCCQKLLEEAAIKELSRILEEGIEPKDLENGKQIYQHTKQRILNTNAFWSSMIFSYDYLGLDLADFFEHEKLIDNFTVDEANTLIRQLFDLEHYSIVTPISEN